MSQLKISIVTPTLSKGGVERAYLLAQALLKLHYQVEIVGFLFEHETVYPLPPEHLQVCSIPGADYPQFFVAAKRLLEQLNGDIIYAVKPKVNSFGLALLKQLGKRCPVILDIDDWELSWHGGESYHYKPTVRQLARDLLQKKGALRSPEHPLYLQWMEKLISRADAITTHTQFLLNYFGGTYLPNGKDTGLFNPNNYDAAASRRKYGLTDYRVLMFPGAPRPYKGLEDILVALDQINQADLRLVIVGGSPYDNYDQELLEKWGRWIIKLPRFSVQVMPEVVAAAHIVVIPQRDTLATRAQFPLKLTDGMAMAKPILSTHVGDIPEILGDTGYLVAPGSPEQLAQKIQWIFQHLDVANAQGIKARMRCIEHYSIETMASILEMIISRLK